MAQRILYFHQIFTHKRLLVSGQAEYKFFDDNQSDSGQSITGMGEHAIVKWIFDDMLLRQHFTSCLIEGPSDCKAGLRVEKPIIDYGQLPGDVDILLWPENKPSEAIAI